MSFPIVAALALEMGAAAGLAYLAGAGHVRLAVAHVRPIWLACLAAALAASLAGYYLAYSAILAGHNGKRLSLSRISAVSLVAFGGVLAHGRGATEIRVLRAEGASQHHAKVRVAALTGLEQAVVAMGGWAAATSLLVLGRDQLPASFTLPWAVIPIPATLAVLWFAARYRRRGAGGHDSCGRIRLLVDAIYQIRWHVTRALKADGAIIGMALFWAADAFAVWSGLAAFGVRLGVAPFLVGFATGMVCTRRAAPLAGAGMLTLALSLSIWVSGAPLAAAVAAVFSYRVAVLFIGLPCALASRKLLRSPALPPPRSRGIPHES